jgi:hypothetical protein
MNTSSIGYDQAFRNYFERADVGRQVNEGDRGAPAGRGQYAEPPRQLNEVLPKYRKEHQERAQDLLEC